ncbi:phosphoheptose isomerase [Porphyromonas phage phage007a_Bg4]|uniref:hypothetical protein n=1 Tax=Porphyromonas gingivalis TaxID=837 RepID=UPI0024813D49|nr:hypothetical protein [Porphyromonas gingivalis]MDH7902931.1 hypothetical protein [Porphyromonas gingivalis]
MIITVDFDGTLFRDAFPTVGEVMPGAVDAMRALHRAGHYLIIWTCRYGDRLLDAVNALVAHGIPFDRINDHNPENIRQYGGEAGKKVYAHIYIDDKNLGGFPGWEVALKEISRVEDEYARRRKGLRAPVE